MIEYLYIFLFILLSILISIIVFILSYFLANQIYDSEKLSAYECGFQPFEDARNRFDIKFYLVAILFIIFDLEVSYLFPWGFYLNSLGLYSFWWMMAFLILLTIGFIYEWMKGALNWD
jgi:NADH:ubiquinone oxidoreductase subunit 3 (subunit A)